MSARARERRRPPRRSGAEWGVRVLLALVTLAVGWVVITRTAADAIKGRFPERAHALAPGNGRVTALLADKMLQRRLAGDRQAPAADLARQALARDATAVAAVATLGFDAELAGKAREADRFFTYANALSRRHLPTQLWLIERAVNRGDVGGALHYYDTALRTSRAAQAVLYPVLARALSEQPIRTGLVRMLAGKPIWGDSFIAYLSTNDSDPGGLADLLGRLRARGFAITADADAKVVEQLIDAGTPDQAWRYYVSVRRGAVRDRSRDARFAANLSTPSAFDWRVANDASLAASIQRSGAAGLFDFAVPTSGSGILLQQLQWLPPGTYRLEGHSIGIEQPPMSRPYWLLTCRGGDEIGRIEVNNSEQDGGRFEGRFVVTGKCPLQNLALVARSSDEIAGVSGQIDRVMLTRIK